MKKIKLVWDALNARELLRAEELQAYDATLLEKIQLASLMELLKSEPVSSRETEIAQKLLIIQRELLKRYGALGKKLREGKKGEEKT